MAAELRILLLADSHLGLDLPVRPRVERRRRGHDFLANYAAALAPGLAGEVDIVVHGGDIFDRPRVPVGVGYRAFEPLRRIADRGVPVLVVPGNHERSMLPHARLASHPRVHVFDRPRTFMVEIRGMRVALAGFPYERRHVRGTFPELLDRTGWWRERAAVRLLCMHHCVEGATVGPGDFTFTTAHDVIRARDLPAGFAAVLSGHIHRHQVLTADLRGRPLCAPVLYPGSIERTSYAEAGEPKGYLLVRLSVGRDSPGSDQVRWEFRGLPARPMLRKTVMAEGTTPAQLESAIRALIAAAPPDAVLSIRVAGAVTAEHLRRLSARQLRTFAPATMNVDVRPADGFARASRPPPRGAGVQLEAAFD